jgi:methyl-accepting chemotaxis protein
MRWPWASRRQIEELAAQVQPIRNTLDGIVEVLCKKMADGDKKETLESLRTREGFSGLSNSFKELAEQMRKDHGAFADAIVDLPERFPKVPDSLIQQIRKNHEEIASALADIPGKFPRMPESKEIASAFRGSNDDLIEENSTLKIRVAELEGTIKLFERRTEHAEKASEALKRWIQVTHRLDKSAIPGTLKAIFAAPEQRTKP